MLRRTFLAGAAAPLFSAADERVLDTHLHLRADADACYTHMRGCGVTHAILLTKAEDEQRARREMERRAGRFARSVTADPAGDPKIFENALREGAVSIGELKYKLAVDSPEMRKVYDIAGELKAPVMMHFESFPAVYTEGFERLDKVLKAHPKTNFIGHGPLFWAHISAEVPGDKGYPSGLVKPGGLTSKFLRDFENIYADMSANSGRNALARDEEFARGFLAQHQSKLIFGSDCTCTDGNGGGTKAPCIARATLELSKKLASPEVFRKITWENGTRLFRTTF